MAEEIKFGLSRRSLMRKKDIVCSLEESLLFKECTLVEEDNGCLQKMDVDHSNEMDDQEYLDPSRLLKGEVTKKMMGSALTIQFSKS